VREEMLAPGQTDLGDAGEEREEADPFALLRMTIYKSKGRGNS